MPRLPVVTRDSVPEQYRAAFDEVVASRGGRPVVDVGPVSIMINSPEMARRAGQLSGYLRWESILPRNIIELATLTAARCMDCQFVWNDHVAAARQSGLRNELVDALRDKKPLPAMSPAEAAVVNYGFEFFRTHQVSDATFKAALEQFGKQGIAELTTLMGYYSLVAFNANAFEITLRQPVTEPVLPV